HQVEGGGLDEHEDDGGDQPPNGLQHRYSFLAKGRGRDAVPYLYYIHFRGRGQAFLTGRATLPHKFSTSNKKAWHILACRANIACNFSKDAENRKEISWKTKH